MREFKVKFKSPYGQATVELHLPGKSFDEVYGKVINVYRAMEVYEIVEIKR